jgi:glutathione S-transferase
LKLYTSSIAPNPRRVHVFLAEKGVELERVDVDINSAANRQPDFMARNPMAQVPVLEFDDGSYLSETMAICRYFEGLHPEPNLLGRDVREVAEIEMWNRRMELEIALPVFMSFQMTHDFFKGRIEQVPEFGAVSKRKALQRLSWLDGELASRDWIAGERFTVADITALCALDFGRVTGIRITDEQKHLAAWHERVSARPSASA